MDAISGTLTWIGEHWMFLLGASYILDKIAKATPWPYDDFVVDIIWNGIKKMLGRE